MYIPHSILAVASAAAVLASQPTGASEPKPAPSFDASIALGAAAKIACSGVFVTGRDLNTVVRSDINMLLPQGSVFTYQIDKPTGTVTARVGSLSRVARFVPGIGCALTYGDDHRVAGVPPLPALPTIRPVAATSPELSRALDAAMRDPTPNGLQQPRAVVVLHHGRVIGERYAPGYTPTTPMLGWSMSKSVNAIVAGLLIADGRLSLDEKVGAPEWPAGDPRSNITVRQLLQMTSGLAFVEDYSPSDDSTPMLFRARDMASYAASKPLVAPPGTRWSYSSGSSVMLSRVIVSKLGGPAQAQAYMRDRLFVPAGMSGVTFEEDATGTPVGASYVYATPRNWARFGQLLLDGGKADGKQVVPSTWIDFIRTPTAADTTQNYGGGFWLNGQGSVQGSRRFAHLPADAYFAQGHNGQTVGIFPSQDVVIVRLGWTTGGQLFDADRVFSPILDAIQSSTQGEH